MPEPSKRSAGSTDFGARTDAGRLRRSNEDRLLAKPPLFVVADGMGGHRAGEVAAGMAVDHIGRALDGRNDIRLPDLTAAVREANRAIHDSARDRPELAGMGTTCTVALLDGQALHLTHVGDSRLYRLRGGRLEALTADHTLVGELVRGGALTEGDARDDDRRHIVTRALGIDAAVEVDATTMALETGDRLLLCSDGLSGEVDDATIARVLGEDADPQRAADRLVQLANEAGGRDNVTVIVVDPAVAPPGLATARPRRRRILVFLAAALVAAIAGLAALPAILPPVPAPSPSQAPSPTPSPTLPPSPSSTPRPTPSPTIRPSPRASPTGQPIALLDDKGAAHP